MSGGEAFVDSLDGRSKEGLNECYKIANFLGGGSVGAVHIAWEANDELFDLVSLGELGEGGGDLLRGFIFEEGEWGGEDA